MKCIYHFKIKIGFSSVVNTFLSATKIYNLGSDKLFFFLLSYWKIITFVVVPRKQKNKKLNIVTQEKCCWYSNVLFKQLIRRYKNW